MSRRTAVTPSAQPVPIDLTDDFSLVYSCGNEYDPANPFGQCVLTLTPNGRVRLDNRRFGSSRSWVAWVDLSILVELVELLNAAGFPVVPAHPIAPGATRTLTVRTGGRELRTPPAGFHDVVRLPGYRELYHLLDSIAVDASRSTLNLLPDARTGLVHRVSIDIG
jgi:hypothetical protein